LRRTLVLYLLTEQK